MPFQYEGTEHALPISRDMLLLDGRGSGRGIRWTDSKVESRLVGKETFCSTAQQLLWNPAIFKYCPEIVMLCVGLSTRNLTLSSELSVMADHL